MMVPLVAMAGMAVDFSRALEVKARIQGIADEAILSSINPGSKAWKDRGSVSAVYTDKTWTTAAVGDFFGQVASFDSGIKVRADMNVQKDNSQLKAELAYNADIPTAFLRVINLDTINVSGVARGVFNAAVFKDFYILVDNSPSMGLGATIADIATMQAQLSCAFACHMVTGNQGNYDKAVATGARFRIDLVRLGLLRIAESIEKTRSQPDLYRASLFSLGEKAETHVVSKISQLVPLTSDMTKFANASQNLKLMTIPYVNYNSYALSDFRTAGDMLNDLIPSSGDGTSVSQSSKYAILITDGVQNRIGSQDCNTRFFDAQRCIDYVTSSKCNALKKRGIKVAVLYTTYNPVPGLTYRDYVKPFSAKIAPALRECASDGLFFEVNPTQGIPEAMEALFAKITAMPILTD